MTVKELMQSLTSFQDDNEITAVLVGWSGTFTTVTLECDYRDGKQINPLKPVIVIDEHKEE
jgi:hypothetical protein